MTKAQQIMALHRKGRSIRQIAEAVYGLRPDLPWQVRDRKMAYVRVVISQRHNGRGATLADLRWRWSDHGHPVYVAKYTRGNARQRLRREQAANE